MEIHQDGSPVFRFSLFEKYWTNKAEAIARYFPEDAPSATNKYMEFGSEIARKLESRPVDEQVKNITHYDINEYRIIMQLGGHWVRGTIDSYDVNRFKFLDNKCTLVKRLKSGKWSAHSWTKKKVYEHEQLVFYSTLIQQYHGWVDDECHISAIPYYINHGACHLTDGKDIMIPRIITQKERDEMLEKIIKTADEINNQYILWKQMQILGTR